MKRGRAVRAARTAAVALLVASACLLHQTRSLDYAGGGRGGASIPPPWEGAVEGVARDGGGGGDFSLCGREVRAVDLPPSGGHGTSFGVYGWADARRGSLDGAILVENRTEKPFSYGRTGNQIREVFHSFDLARDRGVGLVMRGAGFPVDTTLKELFLGVNTTVLSERLGITFYEDLDERDRSRGMETWLQDNLYHYVSKDPRFTIYDQMEHRHHVIQELYRLTAREMELHPDSDGARDMCASLHALFGRGGGDASPEEEERRIALLNELGISRPRSQRQRYTVLHSRGLEMFGKKWMARAEQESGAWTGTRRWTTPRTC